MWLEYYIMGIILIPALIFSTYAQIKVSKTFNKYAKVKNVREITAKQAVEKILSVENINDVTIQKVPGELTDYYNNKTKTIGLSNNVCDSTSVSAIGVALHETGHAMQYNDGYKPVKLRTAMAVVSNFASQLLWPLVIIGLLFNIGAGFNNLFGNICLWAGIGFFGVAIIFNLITLPVEYNASKRAKKIMIEQNILTEEEMQGASEVLNAAALTYVAALIISLLQLVRFLLVFTNRNND